MCCTVTCIIMHIILSYSILLQENQVNIYTWSIAYLVVVWQQYATSTLTFHYHMLIYGYFYEGQNSSDVKLF